MAKKKGNFKIRHAGIPDVPAIHTIINDAAEYGLMLHKSHAQLYENLRDFQVATDKDSGAILGVCGLNIIWANLAEVYALAVAPHARGRGIGKQLVLSCTDEAEELGLAKLMTLTYEQKFFEKCGFAVVEKETLPMKVWSDCVNCAKNKACDEIAMVRLLEAPEIVVPTPEEPPLGQYEVPVSLTWSTTPRAKMDEAHEERAPVE